MTDQITHIPTEAFEASPYQYRRNFTEADMAELVASVQEHGILQPVLARPVSGRKSQGVTHQLVAGHRRHLAAERLSLPTVPAVVRKLTDLDAARLALIENVQRENPDDWATAKGIQNLMQMSAAKGEPLSELAVARELGKSVGFVRNHLGLFKLRPQLQEVAQRHNGVRSSLFEIQKVTDPDIERRLIAAVDRRAGFQEIKEAVEAHLAEAKWKRQSQTPDRHSHNPAERRQREAQREVAASLTELARHVANLEAWTKEAPPATWRAKAVALHKRLGRLL
jgi:ParB family chromosome partitioning protein